MRLIERSPHANNLCKDRIFSLGTFFFSLSSALGFLSSEILQAVSVFSVFELERYTLG